MLRILPYVIVLLAVFSFSKFMNLFNDGTGILDVLSLHAAQESSGSKIDAGSSDQSTKAKAPTTGDGAAGEHVQFAGVCSVRAVLSLL